MTIRSSGMLPVFAALLWLIPSGNLVAQTGLSDVESPPALWRATFGPTPSLQAEVLAPASDVANQNAPAVRLQAPGIPQDAQLECPDCTPPKRFWRGFGEVMIVQLIPWSINYFLRDAEWAKVGPESWGRNLENPWVWDNNSFSNNQFAHPYHGAMYYTAGRTNGYSFWQSVPWAFGGSFMWEIMGEVWAPAPNDLLSTSLGGIVLGEMLFKMSNLVLDNTASGSERVFREIAGTLLNPVGGFNRLLDGKMGKYAANPEDWRPSRVNASMDLGYRSAEATSSTSGAGEAGASYLQFQVYYGDQVADLSKSPFSTFYVNLEIGGKQADSSRGLSQLAARGNLAAHTISESDRSIHQLGLLMHYQYITAPQMEFGGMGFDYGLISRIGDPEGFRWNLEGVVTAMPISAIQSDYFETEQGRDYDYGLGFGAKARVAAVWEGTGMIQAHYRYLWTPVMSGFDGNHYQQVATVEARGYVLGRYGVGASLTWFDRQSNYVDRPAVSVDATQLRLFASLSIPRWGSP